MEGILSMLDTSVILILLVVFLACYWFLSRDLNLPPGPRGIPLLGNIGVFKRVKQERRRLHLILNEMRQEYGDVIMLKAFGQPVVFIHGYEAIQEAFVKHADVFSDRPSWLKYIKEAIQEGKGIIWQSGDEWRATRKFVLQALRDFGVGKTSLEEQIMQEIDAATDYLHNTKGEPTDVRHLTSMMITNVIHGIVFGKRFDYEDEEFHFILKSLGTFFQQGTGSPGLISRHWLLKIFNRAAYEFVLEKQKLLKWIKSFVYTRIEEHEATFDPDNIRDFIDLYLQAKCQKPDKAIYNAGNICRVVLELFLAGSETTSKTVNWCILFMQEYPDIQGRCKEVIQETCGNRNVTWSDRGKLPYVEAVLLEIQRHGNIAPISLPHTNENDVMFQGYKIPRRTLIEANLYSSNMDPKHWEEPQKFNPDRFLENGKLKINPAFMPFSIGPRVCLGESLAKMEMFLTFSNLLQRFTFEREDPNIEHTFETDLNQSTSTPLPYRTRAIPC